MRPLRWILVVLVALAGASCQRQDRGRRPAADVQAVAPDDKKPVRATAVPAVMGSLVFAGGELRFDNARVWERFIELAGGKGASVVVVPAASGNPKETGDAVVANLRRYGARAELLPLSDKMEGVKVKEAVRNEALVAKLRKAGGVWFLGGLQRHITDALLEKGGKKTPALEAIWDAYREGAVIGGTSAGAAVMSRMMFADALNSLETIRQGIVRGKHVDAGLAFVGDDWFVDQHFLALGRFARALGAMKECGFEHGIGVDENTAVVLRDGTFEVVGYKGALVLDVSGAESDPTLPAFNIKKARLTYLESGDRMDARTREVTVAPQRLKDWKVDPVHDKKFVPGFDEPEDFYVSDMLGGWAIHRAMTRALDSEKGVVKGFAFSLPEGGPKNEVAFEFKVYRGKDTVGWYTSSGGYESYTVLNAYLDILPVRLAAPLSTPLTTAKE